MLKHKYNDSCVQELFYKNNIKLIAIDIDGTLADDTGKISDENLKAIEVCKKGGIEIILASGRLHSYAMKMFTNEQIEKYKIEKLDGVYSHGAYIHMKGYDYVYRKFSYKDLELILFSLGSYNILRNAVFLTVDSAYVINDDIKLIEEYIYTPESEGIISDIEYVKIIDTNYKPILINKIKDIFNIGDIVSIEIYDKLYPNQDIYSDLFKVLFYELQPHYKIYIPSSNNKIVLSPINTAKVHTTQLYAQFYRINLNNILSIGNDDNDIELLSSTGFSVAVKNSTPRALRVARCVSTKTNNENAVANIIYRVLSGRRS